MNSIVLFVILSIGILGIAYITPSHAIQDFEFRGTGISLDSNIENPTLYKSSLRLHFTDLSKVSEGTIILRTEGHSIAARVVYGDWNWSYNADGSFFGSGPVRTLQDTFYQMSIQGERKFVASNWSLWEATGELSNDAGEKYTLKFLVSGDDRFASTAKAPTFSIILPLGNADQHESTSYIPEKPTIFRGTTVIWKNLDAVTHTVQSQDGKGNVIPGFNSDIIGPSDSFSHSFSEPGIYDYLCTLHPWRIGVVTVV